MAITFTIDFNKPHPSPILSEIQKLITRKGNSFLMIEDKEGDVHVITDIKSKRKLNKLDLVVGVGKIVEVTQINKIMAKKNSLQAVPISMNHKEIFTNHEKQMQGFHDQISDMIDKQTQNMNHEKERLIKERINQLLGSDVAFDIDLMKAEGNRIFPKIIRVIYEADKSEAYFWDDGTESGKLLITFYPVEFEKTDKGTFCFSYRYK